MSMSETLKLADNLLSQTVATAQAGATSGLHAMVRRAFVFRAPAARPFLSRQSTWVVKGRRVQEACRLPAPRVAGGPGCFILFFLALLTGAHAQTYPPSITDALTPAKYIPRHDCPATNCPTFLCATQTTMIVSNVLLEWEFNAETDLHKPARWEPANPYMAERLFSSSPDPNGIVTTLVRIVAGVAERRRVTSLEFVYAGRAFTVEVENVVFTTDRFRKVDTEVMWELE